MRQTDKTKTRIPILQNLLRNTHREVNKPMTRKKDRTENAEEIGKGLYRKRVTLQGKANKSKKGEQWKYWNEHADKKTRAYKGYITKGIEDDIALKNLMKSRLRRPEQTGKIEKRYKDLQNAYKGNKTSIKRLQRKKINYKKYKTQNTILRQLRKGENSITWPVAKLENYSNSAYQELLKPLVGHKGLLQELIDNKNIWKHLISYHSEYKGYSSDGKPLDAHINDFNKTIEEYIGEYLNRFDLRIDHDLGSDEINQIVRELGTKPMQRENHSQNGKGRIKIAHITITIHNSSEEAEQAK